VVVSLMENSILSEVDDASILRTGLSTPLLLSRLATDLSVHAPAQSAGAQRLCALLSRPMSTPWRHAPSALRRPHCHQKNSSKRLAAALTNL
jgi:hypothetical protein